LRRHYQEKREREMMACVFHRFAFLDEYKVLRLVITATYSPPRRGVAAPIRKYREATETGAGGVARSASPLGRSLNKRPAALDFPKLTTPFVTVIANSRT